MKRMEIRHYQQVLALIVSTQKTRIFLYIKLESTPIKAKTRQDKGESLEIKTQKGLAEFRYDYMLDENLGIYSLADYNYDGKNNAGVLSLLGRFGIGTPLI